jgi:spore maturation protein CgeB
VFYEPDAYDRQKYRDIEDPPYARSVVYKADFAGVRSALHQAKGADVIIKASGVGVFDSLLEQEVLGFQNTSTL